MVKEVKLRFCFAVVGDKMKPHQLSSLSDPGYLSDLRVKSSLCSGQVGLREGQDVPVLQRDVWSQKVSGSCVLVTCSLHLGLSHPRTFSTSRVVVTLSGPLWPLLSYRSHQLNFIDKKIRAKERG